ncbi:MAG: DUF5658 family protein [Gammaproteobacteria bacterium]|nr:DUF5658 family protein [Gammaproteobacteria bacterium]
MKNNKNMRATKPPVMHAEQQEPLEARMVEQLDGQPNSALGELEERRLENRDRRRMSVKSLLHGGLRPRRRQNRRDYNEQYHVLDLHDSELMWLALGIVIMSCLDAMFTLNLLAIGAEEINILMRSLINADINRFLVVKIGATCISVVTLVAASEYRVLGRVPVRLLLRGLFLIYAALLVYEIVLLSVNAGDVFAVVAWPLNG